MNIWIIRDGEPIPSDPGGRRPMRMGMLATELARRGHAVSWFTSSFDHYRKHQRGGNLRRETAAPGLDVVVLPSRGYRKNISLARIGHNRAFARDWSDLARTLPPPDILVTDIPTTELALAVVRYAAERALPVVLSIRDLWPDFFPDYVPRPLRPLARLAIQPLVSQVRAATRGATSLVGISDTYLEWAVTRAGRPRGPHDAVFPLGYAARPADPALVAALRSRLALPAACRLVSFVGSWGATYDLDLIVGLARHFPPDETIFVVAGDDETRPALAAQMRALRNMRVAGWLSADEIAALLSISDIGLLPYAQNAPQGLPNKLFEYMAYGAYQVATLGAEAADFYRHTGAGVTSAPTPEAVAAAIMTAPRGTAQRERLMALFSAQYAADTIYPRMAAHIESLVTARPASR